MEWIPTTILEHDNTKSWINVVVTQSKRLRKWMVVYLGNCICDFYHTNASQTKKACLRSTEPSKQHYTIESKQNKLRNNAMNGDSYAHHPRNSLNSSVSSSSVLNENGWKGHPANSANLENDSTHARRSECNMALVPSIHTRMAIAEIVVSAKCHAGDVGEIKLTEEKPHVETNDNGNDTENTTHLQRRAKSHGPEHNTELLMSKRQSPKTEVRRSVRHAVQAELNGVDNLVNHDFAKLKLLVLLLNVLRNHGYTLTIVKAIAVSVHETFIFLIAIQGANSGSLANAAIALSASAVVLPAKVEGLQE